MHASSYPSRIGRGLRRAGLRTAALRVAGGALILAGITASVLEVAGRGSPGLPLLALVLLAGGLFGLHELRLPAQRQMRVPGRRTKISIITGDIWSKDWHRVIPVNQFFDSELGERVSHGSLHGQAITRCFDGDSRGFETAVDPCLLSQVGEGNQSTGNRRASYPIGTTCAVETQGRKLFFVALSRTHPATGKAEAGVADLWHALCCLWDSVRDRSNGETVAVPLIGAGQSQVPLPTHGLLQILLLSLLHSSARREITSEVVVVLTPDCFEELDLSDFRFH